MRSAFLAVLLFVACQPIDRVTQRTPDASPPIALAPSAALSAAAAPSPSATIGALPQMTEFNVGAGQGPHDVAPAVDGGVWYTAQRTGELGYLDPKTGSYKMTKLGTGSAPHGVIVGPDGNPWITDGGLNAIVRVDAKTNEVTRYPLGGPNVNLNTATFDKNGTLWFTGQSGYFGHLDPKTGALKVLQAPRGPGPYGITTTPDGRIFYASLANSHIAWIDPKEDVATPIDPPTPGQGARRVWSDSKSQIWVSEWNAGQLGFFSAHVNVWKEWKLPGANPMPYAVYVDDQDVVWLSDFGANAIVRFDPKTETFTSLPHSAPDAAVRQLLGRPGEVWGAMSGQDKLVFIRTSR
jgi:virginiamycin B lyase